MSGSAIAVLEMFGSRLTGDLAFSLTGQDGVDANHPLAGEIEAVLAGKSASLPYPTSQNLMWVSVAPTAKDLRRLIEDLRCWVIPSFGWEASPSVVSAVGSAGRIGTLLLAHSPQGYFRWHSRSTDIRTVVERLATMRAVIARAPIRQALLRPSVEMLRRQFTLSLATGDRDAALQAIDQIDQRQLDTAPNALSMRIRLAASFGEYQAIVDNPQLDYLLSTRIPQRVVESVLLAHHAVFLAEHELEGDVEAARTAYRPFYDRLAGLADGLGDKTETPIARMAAYDAAAADDAPRLLSLAECFSDDEIITALAASTPAVTALQGQESTAQTVATAKSAVEAEQLAPASGTPEPLLPLDWSDVPSLVATSAWERLAAFLQHAELIPDACFPGDGDFLLELFTDSGIVSDAKKSTEADHVLTTVIDAYVCEERFPRRERLTLYQAILDIWSSNRAMSTDPIDGQLLLTMADAMLRLDGRLEAPVSTAIARWWEARPVRSRLAWLGEALELLTEQSVAQDCLALWYAGAALIKVDHEGFTLADRHLWRRVGRRLGLDGGTTDVALGEGWQDLEAIADPLLSSGYKKIAIVSLHERAAREAASQIEERTHADVIVVTDQAAGEGTASAATADVILFVWGATKHAVYRAFDKVRDRLEYVQGTGSASIVRALERRYTYDKARIH